MASLLPLLFLPVFAGAVQGQPAPLAEAYVASEHWSREALRRLSGVGLIDAGSAAAAWPLPRDRVRGLLESAVNAASIADGPNALSGQSGGDRAGMPGPRGGSGALDLAQWYLARFRAEYPEPAAPASGVRWSARAATGWGAGRGELRGGTAGWVDDVGWVYGGPVHLDARSELGIGPELDVGIGHRFAFAAGLDEAGRASRAADVYGTIRLGGAQLWGGRRGLGFGPASRHGIVLSPGATRFHGAGFEVPAGRALPGFLGVLGPTTGALMVARLERSGPVARPWFWAGRLTVAPHASLAVGFNRAAIFGGAGNEPVTARSVMYMLLGLTETEAKSSEFENQVASVDAIWRARAGGVPVVVYGEWGLEDVPASAVRVPGLVLGVELPVLPGVPRLGAAVEHVSFGRSGGGYPPWYRHGPLGEGWTDRGRLLGHPLGGHGTEWGARVRWTGFGSGTDVAARTFLRNRGEENLFSPDRIGSGHGAALDAALRAEDRFRGYVRAEWEAGRSGWTRWTGTAGLRVTL